MDLTNDCTFNEAVSTATETLTKETSKIMSFLLDLLNWNNFFKLIGFLVVILICFIVYKLITRGLKKLPEEKVSKHKQLLIQRIIKYTIYFLLAMYVLSLFGIKLSAIWGAAGIAGIAIGFAAQTSVSNIISGIFVITEGALKIGDTIIVDGVTGVIDSINLLSVRVHTYDNQMVRIPNSTIINSNLINNSYHKVRRMTISVGISYDTDLQYALDTLNKVPALCPTILQDPAPAVWFDEFGDSSIKMTLALWYNPVDFLATKNTAFISIKKVFDAAEINIPFNQIDVHFNNIDAKEIAETEQKQS